MSSHVGFGSDESLMTFHEREGGKLQRQATLPWPFSIAENPRYALLIASELDRLKEPKY
jgi:hypothetical protein